jgi:hypothetical protein
VEVAVDPVEVGQVQLFKGCAIAKLGPLDKVSNPTAVTCRVPPIVTGDDLVAHPSGGCPARLAT